MRRPNPLPPHLARAPFSLGDGREAGLTRKRLLAADLHRPFRGVRVAGSYESDLRSLCEAYSVRMPRGGFFSSVTAARLHGIPVPPRHTSNATIHVAVPRPARAPRGRGVSGHSVACAREDVVLLGGLPVSAAHRTWCELGEVLDLPDLVAAGDRIVHWRDRLSTVDGLTAALSAYPGRRGASRLREALGLLHERAESPQESLLRVMLVRAGLVGVSVNEPIRTTAGRLFRADLAFVAHRVIIEYQGDHHRERMQYREDLLRALLLQADGWTVIQVGPDDMRDPEALVARIRAILAAHPPVS